MSVENLLEGRRGVVVGVANKRSIAWAIAKALSAAGARLAFTYQGEKVRSRVEELAKSLPQETPLYPCDVTRDDEIAQLGDHLKRDFTTIDFLIHSVAYAEREDLEGSFLNTSRRGFLLSHEVSAFSLTVLARMAAPLMPPGSSVITLTYLGGERAVKRYNVMGVAKAALESSVRYLAVDLGEKGIRINAISAGPINTLAARGISGFTEILKVVADRAPLKRNVEAEEVANTALFLASPLAAGITGEVIYVDAGFHILGL